MATTCFTVCPECSRHVRCGERSCPFCGARVSSGLRILEYRIKNRLSRGQALSLGASLTLAGFISSCEPSSVPLYGAPCNPPECPFPTNGGGGSSALAGSANGGGMGGAPNSGGVPSGGVGGMAGSGAGMPAGGTDGYTSGGASAGEPGLGGESVGGAGGDVAGGAGGQGGAP